MKRIVIAILLMACLMPVMAQRQRSVQFSERFFEAKVNTIVSTMQMSDEKKEQFIPIYREYSQEVITTWNELAPKSNDEGERLKAEMRRQEKTQAIRLKYTERFLKVFTAGEVRKFFKIEDEIQRRVKARKQEARANGAGARR